MAVLLQAMKREPALDVKCRDKFLVQSVTITPDKEFANATSIVRWRIHYLCMALLLTRPATA